MANLQGIFSVLPAHAGVIPKNNKVLHFVIGPTCTRRGIIFFIIKEVLWVGLNLIGG